MIDIEDVIFDAVASAIYAEEPDAYVTGVYERIPPSFPCVMLIEKSNTAYLETRTTDSNENHAVVMYEADVFSNKIDAQKQQCKKLAEIVDRKMRQYGFTRTMLGPVDNPLDTSIYRIKGRYEAVVGQNKMIYRR